MSRPFLLQAANGPQIIIIHGGAVGAHVAYLAFATAPSAGTVDIDYRAIGSTQWVQLRKVANIAITAGELAVRLDAPIAAIRVTFSGLVGGASPILWLTEQIYPDGIFEGLAAITSQSYTEANVKNGVQYEVASYNPALGVAPASQRTIFVTGSKPVAVKARLVAFDGAGIEARVYKNTIYTGGTPIPYFNLSDINPVAGSVQIISGATISNVGTEFGARSYLIGSNQPGSQSVGAFGVTGQERNLAPNTTYMLELISLDAAETQRVGAYLSWYEGGLDLPL